MILIQGGAERSRVGRSPAELILVDVGVVQIIVVESLLLAPNSPSSVGQTRKQQSTSNATDHAANGGFSGATESRASTFISSVSQRSRIDTGCDGDKTAACAGEVHGAARVNTGNCGYDFGERACSDERF